jgi:hypothetical protein
MDWRVLALVLMTPIAACAQGTGNDLFVMLGSDFDRPGLEPRANYKIGIGHTFRCRAPSD